LQPLAKLQGHRDSNTLQQMAKQSSTTSHLQVKTGHIGKGAASTHPVNPLQVGLHLVPVFGVDLRLQLLLQVCYVRRIALVYVTQQLPVAVTAAR
jgi:hypothetical protein